ncbi:KGGVGR-motif variant AAA ATPase [Pseudactinotalea sp. HY158]|uniref:KGGVGR-motif variant AAA ATPase n=1 Tax=Pseudactinotalea sp. HY158 TaxID=2654547 RepID=UPI00129C4D9A|nr:tetratricopeptide repeat protein [Pseudactinotalea sp. HY158]QGH68593.1 tetratricopeptide repeat protein [Pseudactinotalea sp. HY158]
MKRIAFYSYKGGTGRTLALANVAAFCAIAGKKVVVIDMDLEAPGALYKFGVDPAATTCSGLVGWLLDTALGDEEPDSLDGYLLEPDLAPNVGIVDQGGALWLMPAGDLSSPNYFGQLQRLNFDARVDDGSAVDLMGRLLDRIEQDLEPDLVFIDARTGITNSNSLVLSELADEVYALYLDLPEQRDGTRMVFRSLAPLAREGRPTLNVVLSRVPLDGEHRGAGWTSTERDEARAREAERFLLAPANPAEFSIDAVRVFQLHHRPALIEDEHLVLMRLAEPGVAESALAWDYMGIARAILDDENAIIRATAGMGRARMPAATRALLSGDTGPVAGPGSRSASITPANTRLNEPLHARVDRQRLLADSDPAEQPRLSRLLTELSLTQSQVGEHRAAVDSAIEAVERYEQFADSDPKRYLPELADAYATAADSLAAVGDHPAALKMSERAVGLHAELADHLPDAYLPILAKAFNNYAIDLAHAGRHMEALRPAESAVRIRERLAQDYPDLYLAGLATSLSNLSNRLRAVGREEEALHLAARAVDTFERVLPTTPDEPNPSLALALTNYSVQLSRAGHDTEALDVTRRSIDVFDQLTKRYPTIFLPELSAALNNLAHILLQIGAVDEALAPARRSLEIRTQLVQENEMANLPGLALTLNTYATALDRLGHVSDARAAAQRSVAIREELASANPAANLPALASSLDTYARVLTRSGDPQSALPVARRAADISRQLTRANRTLHGHDFAHRLTTLADLLESRGNTEDADRVRAERQELLTPEED